MHETAAVAEVERLLRDAFDTTECEECGCDVRPGETVSLQRTSYCADCGWHLATHTLAPLLTSAWTPADIESGRRDYEEARVVLAILSARITRRLAERV